MFKGQKNRILFKNNIWHLGLNDNIYICIKCKKYNSIIKTNDKIIYQHCLFCGNPNYINK